MTYIKCTWVFIFNTEPQNLWEWYLGTPSNFLHKVSERVVKNSSPFPLSIISCFCFVFSRNCVFVINNCLNIYRTSTQQGDWVLFSPEEVWEQGLAAWVRGLIVRGLPKTVEWMLVAAGGAGRLWLRTAPIAGTPSNTAHCHSHSVALRQHLKGGRSCILRWSVCQKQTKPPFLPRVHKLLCSHILPPSTWDSAEGHPETATGMTNEFYPDCWFASSALEWVKKSELEDRIVKTQRFLKGVSHLLNVTSLLQHVIGTRNRWLTTCPAVSPLHGDCSGRASTQWGRRLLSNHPFPKHHSDQRLPHSAS